MLLVSTPRSRQVLDAAPRSLVFSLLLTGAVAQGIHSKSVSGAKRRRALNQQNVVVDSNGGLGSCQGRGRGGEGAGTVRRDRQTLRCYTGFGVSNRA